ncbi:hypothetical protein [Mycolicibacter kumamotonensis]|uniref:hypothetical protein n=1 Tax=Mycolicibacter kumamotonensis TaxID=354243 RepID=UPI000D69BBC4|nr:hypothetical protein [Mycolicibacter kumamotonensis]
MTSDPPDEGERVSVNTVARIMTELGIEGISRARLRPRRWLTRRRGFRRIWWSDASIRDAAS